MLHSSEKPCPRLWRQLFEELRSCKGVDGEGVPREILHELQNLSADTAEAWELYRLDAAMLEYLSDQELRLRILAYRELLQHLLTKDAYTSLCENLSLSNERADLLNEAKGLASRMYRRYVLVPSVEALRADIAMKIFLSVATACVAVALLEVFDPRQLSNFAGEWRIYLVAAAAGASGAAVSTTVRLYRVDPRHEPLLTWMSLEQGKPSLWVAPVLGAVFGMVLVLLINAGVISGALFPANLDDPARAPKLMIWAFIAGWAERFVPDVLNKLAAIRTTRPPDEFLRTRYANEARAGTSNGTSSVHGEPDQATIDRAVG